MIAGFVIGPSMLDWLPAFTDEWFPVLTDVALAMIDFLLGQKLTRTSLGKLGRPVAVVANLARHHERPFREIKGIEWPFLVLCFLLSGARLEIEALAQVGVVGAGYIILRMVGRIIGTYAGGRVVGVEAELRRWMGVALMPQAEVALGMALLAVESFPRHENVILPVILGSTVIFELAGPVATRWALVRAGDAQRTTR